MTTITLPRAVVEQALEALIENARLLGATQAKKGFGCYSQEDARLERAWREGIAKHSAALRAALAQQAEPESCAWHQDGDSESDLYATSCRHYFSLNEGTPEDNKMHWCCYCGKRIVQELITEEDDDE